MLPTFIIAGAGKSGTSSLFRYMDQHPQVCMATEKEPAFFTRVVGWADGGPPDGPWGSGKYQAGIEWYESLFDHCGDAKARGEASTMYMYVPDAPALIRKHLPAVKLIFLLRDPVSRTYSQYWQERKAGWSLPSFDAVCGQDLHPRLQSCITNSHYKQHLERFLSHFPASQIQVLFHEDLRSNPNVLLSRAFDFLGVAPDFEPENLGHVYNRAALPRSPRLQRLLRRLPKTWLSRLLPGVVRRSLRGFHGALARANLHSVDYPAMPEGLRKHLVEEFADDITFVEELTGHQLERWRHPTA